jgi:hypothetical protein
MTEEKYFLVLASPEQDLLKLLTFNTEAEFLAAAGKEIKKILVGNQAYQVLAFRGEQLKITGGHLNFGCTSLTQVKIDAGSDTDSTEQPISSVQERTVSIPIDLEHVVDSKTNVIMPFGDGKRTLN